MNTKQKLQNKMSLLEHEISKIRTELAKKEIYLKACREIFEEIYPASSNTFRKGSMISKAHEFLKEIGEPQYIDKILEGIGIEPTKENSTSLLNSLASYARKEQVFTKASANTFGLKECDDNNEGKKTTETVEPRPRIRINMKDL